MKGTGILMKGLEQKRIQHGIGANVSRVQVLVDWSQEVILIPSPPGWGP